MRVLIIGLGSMGKRRLRLLKKNFPHIVAVGVDANEDRCDAVSEEFGISTYMSVQAALDAATYSYAFICTSPLSHSKIIIICLNNNMHVFTELNLVSDGYRDNMQLAERNGKVLFLSSTFLYRNETRFLIEKIHKSELKLNYSYHVGQYLPDWHPWERYNDFFVAEVRTNGCREIFAIELPWLLQAFGKVADITVIKGNMSSLSLPYPDNYLVTIVHESGHQGQLMVDVVTRVPVRHFEVFGEQLQMEWRGAPEILWIADEDFNSMVQVDLQGETTRVSGYNDFIVEDAYLEEMKTFFAVCDGEKHASYGFAEDLYTLELIDRIEGLVR